MPKRAPRPARPQPTHAPEDKKRKTDEPNDKPDSMPFEPFEPIQPYDDNGTLAYSVLMFLSSTTLSLKKSTRLIRRFEDDHCYTYREYSRPNDSLAQALINGFDGLRNVRHIKGDLTFVCKGGLRSSCHSFGRMDTPVGKNDPHVIPTEDFELRIVNIFIDLCYGPVDITLSLYDVLTICRLSMFMGAPSIINECLESTLRQTLDDKNNAFAYWLFAHVLLEEDVLTTYLYCAQLLPRIQSQGAYIGWDLIFSDPSSFNILRLLPDTSWVCLLSTAHPPWRSRTTIHGPREPTLIHLRKYYESCSSCHLDDSNDSESGEQKCNCARFGIPCCCSRV